MPPCKRTTLIWSEFFIVISFLEWTFQFSHTSGRRVILVLDFSTDLINAVLRSPPTGIELMID